jgi:hypothetical protein
MLERWWKREARGLYSPHTRERRKLNKKAKSLLWTENDVWDETRGSTWNYYDSPPEDQFKPDDPGEGFGKLMSFDDVRAWVKGKQNHGTRIATLDVFGQPGLGLATGADRAIGWSLLDVRPDKTRSDPRGQMIESSVFNAKARAALFNELDTLKASGVDLGLVFFRPLAGITPYGRSAYAHLYMYEYVLRPLYERLTDDGKVFIASRGLVGMPLLQRILEQTEGVEYVRNEEGWGYLITKRASAPTLTSIADMGDLPDVAKEFARSARSKLMNNIVAWGEAVQTHLQALAAAVIRKKSE